MSARILVVEDEEALTTLLRYNLDAEGYEVETVARFGDAKALAFQIIAQERDERRLVFHDQDQWGLRHALSSGALTTVKLVLSLFGRASVISSPRTRKWMISATLVA